MKSIRLEQAISDFLDHAEIGRAQSPRTIRNYLHYLNRFAAFAGNIPIEEISLEMIGKFRLSLNRLEDKKGEQLLQGKSQNYHIIALRAFLKFLIRQGYDVLAPEKVDLAVSEAREVSFLERDELESIMESVNVSTSPGLRDRAILEMLYSTGLRVSEIAALNRDSISLERQEFSVKGKGKKTRIVFISDRCKEWITRYLESRTDNATSLFVPARIGMEGRLSTKAIEEIVRKYARLAGIVKKVTPHTLRHTFATQMLMKGADIRSVQEFLGHASIATTQIYTHVTNAKLREVHTKFHQ